MKENEDIEEVIQCLTQNIQDASWKATPSIHKMKQEKQNTPLHIRQLISEKRRARRIWQRTRNPSDKTNLNRLNHNLTRALQKAKNENFYSYITQLSSDDHSLWKATKKFK
jgi:hypothetical protein